MAGAAIGVVALFLAVASFGVNANTDSNDGECVLLLLASAHQETMHFVMV